MKPGPDHRRAELAKIHILAKQLRLTDEQYRAVLWTVARVDSARDLDTHGRRRVIEQLKSHMPGAAESKRAAPDREPMLHKVRELLGERGDNYAIGILRHMFGKDAPEQLEWATPRQLHKIVAALMYDAKRRRTPAPVTP